MKENGDLITFQGEPLTLVGQIPALGQPAPNATLLDTDLNEIKLSDFEGKTQILSVAPSLDTPVCDAQTRRFNQEASRLGENVVILAISMDLPFAQKRWCGAAGVEAVRTLSDHRDCQFGLAYGLLIKELRLLARAVIVLDIRGAVRYVQVVPEITNEPDYEAVLNAVAELSG
ncbi:MAG: thiol peroxidase [Phycisphaerae bacterium]|nr:thiol peroxidase [Phycisphaerae bacterium]